MSLLQRGADGDYISRSWVGKVAVCIASGPSLTQDQVEQVRNARERDLVRVIAVNDNYLIAPFADVLYYADEKWAMWHEVGVRRIWPWAQFSAEDARNSFIEFRGQKCTVVYRGSKISATRAAHFRLPIVLSDGMSESSSGLASGRNGGHQALNIAALSGAETVLLLGYDASRGDRGLKHGFGEHPDQTEPPYSDIRIAMCTTTIPLKRMGVRVLNCSPGSAIDAFDKSTLKDALESLLPDQTAAALSA